MPVFDLGFDWQLIETNAAIATTETLKIFIVLFFIFVGEVTKSLHHYGLKNVNGLKYYSIFRGMKTLSEILKSSFIATVSILDVSIPIDQYCTLDLSSNNIDLEQLDITNPTICQSYIDSVLQENIAQVAYGGYLEQRNLYSNKSSFSSEESTRNIHLGIDFWSKAGTKVIVPLKGKVHSFYNNTTIGDYGPTIVLEHKLQSFTFYTLYGHLSLVSLENLSVGKDFNKGDCLGTLGTVDINVNYAPHLHFQIIIDMEGKKGDYPGVCSLDTLDFYSKNCPNPNVLLGF